MAKKSNFTELVERSKKLRKKRSKIKKDFSDLYKLERKIQHGRITIKEARKEFNTILRRGKEQKRTQIYATSMADLEDQLEEFKGQTVRIKWEGGTDKLTVNMDRKIPKDNYAQFFQSEIFLQFQQDSDTNFFDIKKLRKEGALPPVVITPLNNVKSKKSKQRFRDGINHCVFQPIREWLEDKLECTKKSISKKSKNLKKRYKPILSKLSKFEEQFKNGLPEDKVQYICSALRIGIKITMPLMKNSFIDCKCGGKPLKIFSFVNTRSNHVEINEIVRTDKIQECTTYAEMMQIKKELDQNGTHYIYTKGKKYIRSISTLQCKYILNSYVTEIINEFEKESGLKYSYIDDIKDETLSCFVRDGTHYNGTIDFNGDRETAKHIDMEKAYFNYKHCKYYNGFLGKITDFRKTDKIQGVGLYRIDNLNFNRCNDNFIKIIEKLNCYVDGNIYGSPELKYLKDNGVTFDILEGCYGVKPLDFEMPESMKEKTKDGIPLYSVYVGRCNSRNLYSRFWLNGDRSYFENLQHSTNETVRFDGENSGLIEYRKETSRHLSHFTAFITMYQRLNMLEQLTTINYNDIVRVCVDGIYYNGDVELKNVFRHKDGLNFNNAAGVRYMSGIIDFEGDILTVNNAEQREHYFTELHLGQGGSGKTYVNLKDDGLMKKLYVCPSWKLARNKQEEYNVNCQVLSNVYTRDKTKVSNLLKYYNVLIFDEISMYTEACKEVLYNDYQYCKLIFCGDIGYQLPPTDDKLKPMTANGFNNVVYHTQNRRAKCDLLRELCKDLRGLIDDKKRLNVYVQKYFREHLAKNIIRFNDIEKHYGIDDMILTYTHNQKDQYTDKFRNKFEKEKYYVTSNFEFGYCRGDIVIKDKNFKVSYADVQHAFTIHSIQGETAKHKLFIDMRRMPSCMPTLLYTAISRAQKLEQIYLIY